jgi:hypothetical protein
MAGSFPGIRVAEADEADAAAPDDENRDDEAVADRPDADEALRSVIAPFVGFDIGLRLTKFPHRREISAVLGAVRRLLGLVPFVLRPGILVVRFKSYIRSDHRAQSRNPRA